MRRHGPGSVPVRRLFFRLDNWLQAQHQPVISTDKYLSKIEQFQVNICVILSKFVKYYLNILAYYKNILV